jgi:hypothetical protein
MVKTGGGEKLRLRAGPAGDYLPFARAVQAPIRTEFGSEMDFSFNASAGGVVKGGNRQSDSNSL